MGFVDAAFTELGCKLQVAKRISAVPGLACGHRFWVVMKFGFALDKSSTASLNCTYTFKYGGRRVLQALNIQGLFNVSPFPIAKPGS
ncbi:hypothetical protein [Granulosicoccus antarcticus]|uniref:hypothetical protein n=1 Tax=Granulosicoccus antarcticus TaxID=437505 RepID=UPI001F3BDEE6|nr:hypothetical protein [Granulosicoccus antarcticus]